MNSLTSPVDLDALSCTTLNSSPFVWGTVRGMLREPALDRLVREFPDSGFTRTERPSGRPGEKGYRTDNLALVGDDGAVEEGFWELTPLWQDLVRTLMSAEYREAVGKLISRDVSRARLEIRAVRYSAGAWIDPHTDRTDKLVTQTWYFNSHWPAANQGQFQVLGSPAADDVVQQVLPLAGESIVLCPSERSWHSVAPVSGAAQEDRKVLLLHLTAV
ncbi:2OG-Fe(II) oxygenase [Streptomyces sp. NPDC057623]|uniref:2OG-Fe(II) oxygenase n=1 Tax=Streptomyces sp. NPDC057623 TaxID=3346187 RepID=UPI0036ADECC5